MKDFFTQCPAFLRHDDVIPGNVEHLATCMISGGEAGGGEPRCSGNTNDCIDCPLSVSQRLRLRLGSQSCTVSMDVTQPREIFLLLSKGNLAVQSPVV